MLRCKEYAELTYKIIGAAMEVHDKMGYGLLEPLYQEALYLELKDRGIESEREIEVRTFYKHHLLEKKYRMDLVVGDVVVELKSVSKIISAHRAQLCNYLRLTKKPVGILMNFGSTSLEGERWALDEEANECILVDRYMDPVNGVDYENLFMDDVDLEEK